MFKKAFLSLVTVFLFFLFYSNDHYLNFLYINSGIKFLIYVLVFITVVLIVKRLNKWMASHRYRFPIEVITSFLLILFFLHEFFTPYFYPENYLKEVGIEKIEMYHQISSSDLSPMEREELAKDAVVKEMAASYAITEYYPKIGLLEKIEVIEFKRNYYQYELLIEGKQLDEKLVKTYQYTFSKEGMDFKIIGFAELN